MADWCEDPKRVADVLTSSGLDGATFEVLEHAAILAALNKQGGNRTNAAKSLGISTRTLQRKLKRLGQG